VPSVAAGSRPYRKRYRLSRAVAQALEQAHGHGLAQTEYAHTVKAHVLERRRACFGLQSEHTPQFNVRAGVAGFAHHGERQLGVH
jgi:hypothetical protein